MRILLLGGGGREHALAWALSKSARVEQILWAPGNGARLPKVENRVLNANDPAAVAACVRDQKIDFVVIGPEAPLEAGVSDVLIEAGVPVFGPSKAAAMLEVSKSFTKEICDACGAPTAGWKRFDAAEPALAYLEQTGAPIVVKADGLAAGKGVTVAETLQQARDAVNAIFAGGAQGAVVIEEFLEGEEASLFAFVSGEEIRVFACAQDHKRVFEGDQGPNTGGMGAYSPAPVADAELQARAVADILQPVMREMVKRGAPYHGIIFAGLMIKDGAPKLIEFNARFGDPEAQTLLPLLQSDLLPLLLACAAHGDKLNAPSLSDAELTFSDAHSLCVVLAAEGYPGAYDKGAEIGNLTAAAQTGGVVLFHAGTKRDGDRILANGGRVLNIVGQGGSLKEARDAAYAAVDAIEWPSGFCRRDIGWRALGTDAQ